MGSRQAALTRLSFGQQGPPGMHSYRVAIVERGMEALWRSYWITSGSEGTVDAAPSGLGRTHVVRALSVEEAIDAVQGEHPDCTVMLAGASAS